MPERRPADDRRISWHPTATGRCPGSHRWATGRSSLGHRPKFLSSAKWIGRSPNSRLAVAARHPVHDFYDMVQGRKNPAMICRCQKTGIGGKSGDHRTIYKGCDVGISNRFEHPSFRESCKTSVETKKLKKHIFFFHQVCFYRKRNLYSKGWFFIIKESVYLCVWVTNQSR